MVNIAVVGAGVVGLSTAVNIQQQIPRASVTIFADKYFLQTTSDGAAGIYRITTKHAPKTQPTVLRQWAEDSWRQFDKLACDADGAKHGVIVASGYQLFNKPEQERPVFADIVYHFRDCTQRELDTFGVKYKHGYFFTTVIVECRWYLPYLMKQFTEAGGRVKNRTVASLNEFVGEYDVVVNCSGLASKTLANDETVFPVRGQLIRAHAPWIKHFVYTDDLAYIINCQETTVVGGTRQRGDGNLSLDPKDTREIWERCTRLLPSIKGAKTQWEWTGLRPTREPIRVEAETMTFNGRPLKVVHNYGHGGNGVSLSWGTAVHAAQLVKQTLGTQAKL